MTVVAASGAQRRSDSDLGLLAGAAAVFVWGFGPVIVASLGISVASAVFWRLAAAVPVMIAAAVATGGGLDRAVLRRAVGPGLLFAASIGASFLSFHWTSVANGTLISSLTPVIVMLVAPRMFGERIRARQLLFGAAAICGIALVVVSGGKTSGAALRGDAMALLNLFLFASYLLWVKRVRDDDVHSWSFLAAVFTVAALAAMPVCFVVSDDLWDVGGLDAGRLLLMVFGPGLVGHGLMTWAQKHIAVTVASLLTLASPVLSVIGAWLLLGQRLVVGQALGAVVVLVSLAAIALNARAPSVIESGLSVPPE